MKPIRRQFLKLAGLGAGALALGGCGVFSRETLPSPSRAGGAGSIREYAFEVAPMDFELDGRVFPTWDYHGGVPGPELRITEDNTLRVRLKNGLPADTTTH